MRLDFCRGEIALPSTDSAPEGPLRVTAIVTTYFPASHAGVLVTKFLRGFRPTTASSRGVSSPAAKPFLALFVGKNMPPPGPRTLARAGGS